MAFGVCSVKGGGESRVPYVRGARRVVAPVVGLEERAAAALVTSKKRRDVRARRTYHRASHGQSVACRGGLHLIETQQFSLPPRKSRGTVSVLMAETH